MHKCNVETIAKYFETADLVGISLDFFPQFNNHFIYCLELAFSISWWAQYLGIKQTKKIF